MSEGEEVTAEPVRARVAALQLSGVVRRYVQGEGHLDILSGPT